MTVMRSATLGFALALGAAGAQSQALAQQAVAQSVTTRQIQNGLVETTVTQTPTGTVITRRPLATAPASTTEVDETVGAGPTTRPRHIVHHARRTTDERTARRTVHARRHVAAARRLALAPAQRRVIYRTLVQEQVIPRVVAQPVPVVPGYPPFPPPAYQPRTVVAAPSATTGYAVSTPVESLDDDVYGAAPAAAPVAAPVYAAPGPVYTVGSVLPASVAVAPLPATAAVAVPSARPYYYATVDDRVLLVDPATNTVVADITP